MNGGALLARRPVSSQNPQPRKTAFAAGAKQLAGSGLTPLFPVWGIPTDRLAHDMISAGLKTRLSCVDMRVLGPSFAGREFNATLVADLPRGVDPCGENGEFHTCVCDGPMFAGPVRLWVGRLEKRDPFAWADLLLDSACAGPRVEADLQVGW